MGVPLGGQVQRGVGRIQVGVPAAPVSEPAHVDRTEHRAEWADVPGFHSAVADAVAVGDFRPHLARRPPVQLTLQHLAQQLPPTSVELVFQLGVSQAGGLGSLQPAEQLGEARPRAGERVPGRSGRTHPRPPPAVFGPTRRRIRSRARPASAWASSFLRASS